jgi:S-formylglutathione hydrolase FrmB
MDFWMRGGAYEVLDGLWHLRLIDGPVPIIIYLLAGIAMVVLLARRPLRRLLVSVIAAACGAALGWVIAWLVSDVWDSFGVALSVPTRLWFTATVALVFVALVGLGARPWWRNVVAALSVVIFVLMGGVGINADIGEFPALGQVFGKTIIPPLSTRFLATLQAQGTAAEWTPPANLRMKGRVGTVDIPGTVSHFAARPAIVYLPPAALAAHAPVLPILIMLSGQPGAPSNVATSAALPSIADGYARAHRGLAPIVVIPDQLGATDANPMCVDSPLGNSATYLTVDVPRWIRSHLHVLGGPSGWAIGGFSQGGTCSIQLGAAHPELFGDILDISGQVAPHRGSIAATVRDAFAGSQAGYEQASPLSLLAVGAPYPRHTLAIFAVGARDTKFAPGAAVVARAAAAAGMDVHRLISPGTAHDWHTVQYALVRAFPLFGAEWGLK